MLQLKNLDLENSLSKINKFKELSEKCSSLLNFQNISVKPYHDSRLPHFSNLSHDSQTKAIQALQWYLTTIEAALKSDDSLRDSGKCLWHALKVFEFMPQNEFFEVIDSSSVVEIYDLSGTQIWRNFKFLEICSYTLEEMYCIEWHLRYQREPQVLQSIVEKIEKMLNEETPKFYHAMIQTHHLTETMSEKQLRLKASHDYLARIYNKDGVLSAWAGFSKVQILKEKEDTQSKNFTPLLSIDP